MVYDYRTSLASLQDRLRRSETIHSGSDESHAMNDRVYEVRRVLMDLNCNFHTHEEIVGLFSQIIGKPVDPSFEYKFPNE